MILEVDNLQIHYATRSGTVRAVDGASFSVPEGKIVGLVGESGCGKTTAGRAVLRLIEPSSGSVKVEGREITGLSKAEMRPYRRQMQIVFQDPFSSLNPRIRVGDIVGEPLKVHGVANLRVADSGIFPTIPSSNTNIPSIAVGEKAADLILGAA